MLDNHHDKRKIYRSLGYADILGGSGAGLTSLKSGGSEATLAHLSRVFKKEIGCEDCGRTFVDEQGLTKHRNMLHSAKPLTSHIKYARAHAFCELSRP